MVQDHAQNNKSETGGPREKLKVTTERVWKIYTLSSSFCFWGINGGCESGVCADNRGATICLPRADSQEIALVTSI